MTNSVPPAIEVRDLWFSYGSTGRTAPTLEAVELTVRPGELVAILGPNGGGKTTLLKLLLGLLRPQQGTIRILGRSPHHARGQVGYVPQVASFEASFPIRVLDVVLMGRLRHKRALRGYADEDRAIARGMLEPVGLADFADVEVGALSGGQLQRVLIARALASEPSVLLMDEPTASLDTVVGHGVWEVLELLSKRITVVVVSHDIGAVSRHVGGIACLNRRLHYHAGGEVTADVLEEVYGCPVELVAHGHPHRVLEPHPTGAEVTPHDAAQPPQRKNEE